MPVGHKPALGGPSQLPAALVLQKLAPLFADPDIEKIAHNGKFDLAHLASKGIDTRGFAFDTLLGAYILGEGALGDVFRAGAGSLSLKWLTSRRLGFEMREVIDLVGKNGVKQLSMDQTQIEDALPYVCENVDYTLRLREPLEKEMREQGEMWRLFEEVEMPLVPVLARMEAMGIALDTSVLRDMSVGLNEQIAYLESQAYQAVGHEFNLGSPPQLSTVLFEELSLPKTRKTKQGYSTDAQSIEALRGVHEIVDIILRWRELTKLRSTYIETLPGAVDPRDGRIHTTYDQAVAATGRLSSNNPNLQNIPVRSELGGQVRRAFVARDIGEDPVLLSADYSQIELRILAHMCEDPMLLEAFHNDEDIHAATAAQVFGVPLESGDAHPAQPREGVQLRRALRSDRLRPGPARGHQPRRSARLHQPLLREVRLRAGLARRHRPDHPRDGYAETLAGRRRYIPDIHSL